MDEKQQADPGLGLHLDVEQCALELRKMIVDRLKPLNTTEEVRAIIDRADAAALELYLTLRQNRS